jgi:hypothetical protein
VPAISELKASVCKLAALRGTPEAERACGAAKLAPKERDPVRLVRLLHIAAAGSGTASPLGAIIGSDPGYIWEPDSATGLAGTQVLFYVEKLKRFATTACISIYRSGGIDYACGIAAARLLHAGLTS